MLIPAFLASINNKKNKILLLAKVEETHFFCLCGMLLLACNTTINYEAATIY